ncbi:MAG: 1-deoxy-D-xylulose-5-phosphate reductoisomerase [Defluviitaleaceae bacterium]|nr:1-deoxy-D-xylulose-5-phosphate reductoisomerase [Defluviitaleaceae bacterium]
MKKLAILGSTGSIGTQALDTLRHIGGFSVEGLSCSTNIALLLEQIQEFKPKHVCVTDEKSYYEAKKIIGGSTQILHDLEEFVDNIDADIALNSLVGSAGLKPTIRAIEKGMDIALANKETLVCAGKLIMDLVKEKNVRIIPVDSEHSAIFQCLQGNSAKDMTKIHLTASGGPFRKLPKNKLTDVSVKDALAHPNWAMGKKITIDSATLMNKGLEMIEAKWLFDIDMDNINVIIHPESIIHSMVEFRDGSIMAQLGDKDMKVPIAYALTYPDRAPLPSKNLDFFELKNLTFEKPRYEDFPALSLCMEAVKIGGTMPALLNGANEAAVALFLEGAIKFTQIPVIIEKAMAAYTYKDNSAIGASTLGANALRDIIEADLFGKNYIYEVIKCL